MLSSRYSGHILIKTEFLLWQILKKYSDIKFHENPSNGSRAVPCGQTDGRTDKKITVVFRNFVTVHQNNWKKKLSINSINKVV